MYRFTRSASSSPSVTTSRQWCGGTNTPCWSVVRFHHATSTATCRAGSRPLVSTSTTMICLSDTGVLLSRGRVGERELVRRGRQRGRRGAAGEYRDGARETNERAQAVGGGPVVGPLDDGERDRRGDRHDTEQDAG